MNEQDLHSITSFLAQMSAVPQSSRAAALLANATALLEEVRRLQGEVQSRDEAIAQHLARIEEMAEERHLLHSSLGKGDRFWGCSRGPCRTAAHYLRETPRHFSCRARQAGTAGGNLPQDCDWPHCGCDPAATRVLAALEEEGRGA